MNIDWSHIQVVLDHIPVIGGAFCALLLATGWKLKNRAVIGVALAFIALGALATVPVFFTGEPAKKVIENISSSQTQSFTPTTKL